MISEEHTQSAVQQLLNAIRDKERELYNNNTLPLQINSDRSIVLLKASMKVFSGDNMEMYLMHCWRIVLGTPLNRDLDFCVIQACKGHFTYQACYICKNQYSVKDDKYRVSMYILSLLVNAKYITEIRAMVFDACILLGIRSNSTLVKDSTHRKDRQ